MPLINSMTGRVTSIGEKPERVVQIPRELMPLNPACGPSICSDPHVGKTVDPSRVLTGAHKAFHWVQSGCFEGVA